MSDYFIFSGRIIETLMQIIFSISEYSSRHQISDVFTNMHWWGVSVFQEPSVRNHTSGGIAPKTKFVCSCCTYAGYGSDTLFVRGVRMQGMGYF